LIKAQLMQALTLTLTPTLTLALACSITACSHDLDAFPTNDAGHDQQRLDARADAPADQASLDLPLVDGVTVGDEGAEAAIDSCVPSCAGKPCGTTDGCGGICKVGSGCNCAGAGCNCAGAGDANTVALYTFEGSGSTVTDVAGGHHGKTVGSGLSRVTGMGGCGDAMRFSSTNPISYVEIPNAAAWNLSSGSVDLWVRFDGTGAVEDILAREANSQANAGHITLSRLCNGSVWVRLQDTSSSWTQCSDPVSAQTWHHVGVNFGGSGGLRLYVGGKQAQRSKSIACPGRTFACDSSSSKGIAGNSNPWVLGTGCGKSNEGSALPVSNPLSGRIDSVRISSVRRTF
jgi:hypothetical protein